LEGGLAETLTLMQELENLCDNILYSISILQAQIDQLQHLNTVLIKSGKEAQNALFLWSSSLDILSETCENLADLIDSLSGQLNNSMQAGESAHQIMQGLAEVLGRSIEGIAVTHSLKGSGNTMYDTLGNQINKLEANSNILSLDPDAKLLSFTSDKNNTPESIQVILRTQEISLMKNGSGNSDAETQKADRGVWGRIIDIFVKIAKALASIFE
jgi:hypothetical protein